jgi:hypothetical protein
MFDYVIDNIREHLHGALDACAPDGNSWIKGWRVFNARWAFDGFLRLRELNYNLFRDKSNT